jgi:hypothetical protein
MVQKQLPSNILINGEKNKLVVTFFFMILTHPHSVSVFSIDVHHLALSTSKRIQLYSYEVLILCETTHTKKTVYETG